MKRTLLRQCCATLLACALGSLLAAPAAAQAPAKVVRVGLLSINPPIANVGSGRIGLELAKLGYVEGRNLVLEVRSAGGHADRLPEMAAELVKLNVDVIVAVTSPAVFAARDATHSIPIVGFAMHGALETGLVSSLRRPGGNITGTDSMALDLDGKRLEIFKQLVPAATRLTVLYDLNDQGSPHHLKAIESAARSVGLTVGSLTMRQAEDLAPLFATRLGKAPGVIYPLTSNTIFVNAPRIMELASANGFPTLCEFRQMVRAGCLLSYGPSLNELAERSALQIDRILRGTPTGEVPVERPTLFELAINLKTANALGLTVPKEVLLRADEVIE